MAKKKQSVMPEAVDQLVRSRALTPQEQRLMWARTAAIRHFLVKAGLCTREEFDEVEQGCLKNLESKIRRGILQSAGVDPEEVAEDGQGESRN